MSKQKDKGTRRETKIVRLFQSFGLEASRAHNNAASKDVILKVKEFPFAIEVKDRQALNLHKTLADVEANWDDEIPAVVWHKTEKSESGRAKPSGPTLIALRVDDFAMLMARIGEKNEELEG